MTHRSLDEHLARYDGTDDARAAADLFATVGVYALALAAFPPALHAATSAGPWALAWGVAAGLSLVVIAGAQVRAFLVHHDLAHGSFFSSRAANRVAAVFVGALVSTSPSVWQREHARHHRDSNNLDREQDGQTAAWTVERYDAAPAWQRWAYWVVNQRPVLFGVLPTLYFLGFMRARARWYENAVFAAFVALLWATDRLGAFALAMLPATAFGFLVFHAQHTFPSLVRRRTADYDFVENGLKGASLLVVPRVPVVGGFVRWCLYGVEYHHVHHLRPGLPARVLARVHDEGGALFDETPRITLPGAWDAARLALYDEARGRLVTFDGHAPWVARRSVAA